MQRVALTGALETGSLQRYLSLLVAMAALAGAWPFFGAGPATPMAPVRLDDAPFGVVVVALIGIAATVGTTLAYRQRLLAVVLMGAVGLAVCLAFVWFSAPDLALTQLLVEMATVVLLMLALRWLPATSPDEPARWKPWLHAALALAAGLGVAALTWLLLSRPSASISDFFLANALPLGGGSNAVNVIIVDFRAFDTLGEITVFGIAALVMHALLCGLRAAARACLRCVDRDKHPLMLQLASRAGAAVCGADLDLPAAARPQPARRRLHRRARAGHRAAAAVRGARPRRDGAASRQRLPAAGSAGAC